MTELQKMISQCLNNDCWCRLASYLVQFQFKIIIYKEISHGVNQICSGHNFLVIPVSPWSPDDYVLTSSHTLSTGQSYTHLWHSQLSCSSSAWGFASPLPMAHLVDVSLLLCSWLLLRWYLMTNTPINLGQSLVRGCSSFGRSTEHEFCQYLEWELNIDPDTLMELKDMVQKDFTGPGPYPTHVLPAISQLVASTSNPFPIMVSNNSTFPIPSWNPPLLKPILPPHLQHQNPQSAYISPLWTPDTQSPCQLDKPGVINVTTDTNWDG